MKYCEYFGGMDHSILAVEILRTIDEPPILRFTIPVLLIDYRDRLLIHIHVDVVATWAGLSSPAQPAVRSNEGTYARVPDHCR